MLIAYILTLYSDERYYFMMDEITGSHIWLPLSTSIPESINIIINQSRLINILDIEQSMFTKKNHSNA